MKRSNVRSASSRCAFRGLRRLDDLVAGVAQRAPERLQNLLFIVDEENGAAMVRHHDAPCATLAGVPSGVGTPA